MHKTQHARGKADLAHKSPQARLLQRLEHFHQLIEPSVPDVQFDLELADGESRESGEECGEGVEFPAFEVDFENIDVGVA